MAKEFPNNRTMIVMEDGGYESTIDDETELFNEIANSQDAQEEEEASRTLYCDFDTSPALIVTKKVLAVQLQDEPGQQ